MNSEAGSMAQRDDCKSGESHRFASSYDWTLLGFAAAASVVFLLGNGVVFWNRRRRYFQSHGGAWLIVGGSFGGLIWIMSAFVVNGHFKRRGLLGHCILWTFWMQGAFGYCIWFSAIILRLHNISLLATRNSRNRILVPAYVAISWVLVAGFSILATRGDFFETCKFKDGAGCKLKDTPKVLSWVIMVAPYSVGIVWLLVRLRNELREPILAAEYNYTFEYFVMACIIMVLTWVTFLTKGHRHISGRCFLTFCDCCLVFCYFWVKLGWPIYLCVFKPEEMDRLDAELAGRAGSLEALEAVYEQRSMHVPSSEGAALERVTRATEELETYKARIRELEAKKTELLRLLELRQRRGSSMEIQR